MSRSSFECPVCEASIEIDDADGGSHARCPACSSFIAIPEVPLEPGISLGDYILERMLGAGAMGDVWLATQKALRRKVALKILSPSVTKDPEFVARFLQEMRLVAKLSHPNIVAAYDSGFDRGLYFLAEEYVEGAELKSLLKARGALKEREALLIARGIAEALDYAWKKFKILHRDIKPANIMLDAAGEPKLMDLGISKSLSEETSMTMTGVVVGTPDYMSPEQGMGEKEMDFRSDLYSLGATLYHMTAGELPYKGPTPVAVVSMHLNSPIPSAREKNHELSKDCDALIRKMMAKERDERHSSWEELIKEIDLVLEGKALPAAKPAQAKRTEGKTPKAALPAWLTALLAIASIAVIAAAAAVAISSLRAPREEPKAPQRPPQPAKVPSQERKALLPVQSQSPSAIPKKEAQPAPVPGPSQEVKPPVKASVETRKNPEAEAEARKLYEACQGDANASEESKAKFLEAFKGWVSSDPASAANWLSPLEENPLRNKAIFEAAIAWTSIEPEKAANWAESFSDGKAGNWIPTREFAINRVAEAWGRKDPEKAKAWAESLNEPSRRAAAIPLVAKAWASMKPEAAISWVDSLPKDEARDKAIDFAAQQWAYKEPRKAADWASARLEGNALILAMRDVIVVWARKDRQAAETWVRESSLPVNAKASTLGFVGK